MSRYDDCDLRDAELNAELDALQTDYNACCEEVARLRSETDRLQGLLTEQTGQADGLQNALIDQTNLAVQHAKENQKLRDALEEARAELARTRQS